MSVLPYPAYKESGVEWIGRIPVGWTVLSLKRDMEFLTSGSRGWAEHYADDGALFIRIGNLTRDGLGLDLSDIQRVTVPAGPEGERTRVRAGDVLFSITAFMGSVAVVPYGTEPAYVSQHVALARIRGDLLSPKWVGYSTLSSAGKAYLDAQCYGGTKIQLSLDDVANLPIAVPPLDQQRVITAFLDRETGKIDALVAEQERLMALLKEKRQAVISQAVTKGLNPYAKMKPSGVEWLGEVPAHWRCARLKHIVGGITVGVVVMPSQYYADEGVPALRGVNVREMAVSLDNLVYFDDASNRMLEKSMLRADDLVCVRTGKPGTTAIVGPELDGANCIDLIVIRRSCEFDSRFMAYVMNSDVCRIQYVLGSEGAMQQHFNVETAGNLELALPAKGEQKEIALFLDRMTDEIDVLAREATRAIALLKERRAALISAAVTGKIDVRDLAAAAQAAA